MSIPGQSSAQIIRIDGRRPESRCKIADGGPVIHGMRCFNCPIPLLVSAFLAAATLLVAQEPPQAPAPPEDLATLPPQEQAERLGIKLPKLPWHVADFWWNFEKPIAHFESLEIDVTIDRDLPLDVNLYVSPLGVAQINGLQFYGGLQTNINGWAGKESRERVNRGLGAIFSRWSSDEKTPIGLGHVRMAADGLCESAGYEGEFCSVRRPLVWGKGTYTYSVLKGDSEVIDGVVHTWFHCLVRAHSNNVTTAIGSLRFEGSEFTYWAKHAAFVEIYSTQKIPRSKIPRVVVTFGYPRINGIKPITKRTTVNYNATGRAMAPACAKAHADGENLVVELGPIFQRDPAAGNQALEVTPHH